MSSNNAEEIIAAIIITLSIIALIVLIACCAHSGRGNNVPNTYHATTPVVPVIPYATTHHTVTDRIPTPVCATEHHASHTNFCPVGSTNMTTTLPGAPVHHANNHSSSFLTTYSNRSGGDFGHGEAVKISSANHHSSSTRPSTPHNSFSHLSSGSIGHTSSYLSSDRLFATSNIKIATTTPNVPVHHANNHSSSSLSSSRKMGGDFGGGGGVKVTSPAHSMSHMGSRPMGHTPSFAAQGNVHHGGGGGKFGKH